MYTEHGRGADLFFFAFSHGPILIQINLQHSQAQPYGTCTRIIFLTQTHYMWTITRRRRSIIFKVFMTRPRVD